MTVLGVPGKVLAAAGAAGVASGWGLQLPLQQPHSRTWLSPSALTTQMGFAITCI